MFTNPIPKPLKSEPWNGIPKPEASETYSKIPKPLVSEAWTGVRLETAPASNAADIAESDYVVVDDNNPGPGNNKFE